MKSGLSFLVISILFSTSVFAAGQIQIAYSPYTISQPGSYIVVSDLTVAANANCITIETSDVTLDLNGHTLSGAGKNQGTSSSGSAIYSDYSDIAVTNGIIRDFRWNALNVEGGNDQITHLRALDNGTNGIDVGSNSLVEDCIASNNGSSGIVTYSGSVVKNNTANGNGYGLFIQNDSSIIGNTVTDSLYFGIFASSNEVIVNNSISSNLGDGVQSGEGCTVIGNSIISNSGLGIYTAHGSLIKDNTISNNHSHGIWATSNCLVSGNLIKRNGNGSGVGAGIYCQSTSNVIEYNVINSNDTGLLIIQSDNYIANNKLNRNTLNMSTVAGNFFGTGDNANVEFYFSPNYFIKRFVGFDISVMRETPTVVLRDLIW